MFYITPKDLSAPGLLRTVKASFGQVADPLDSSLTNISLTDYLMSGVALFGLKFPSLLQFDQSRDDEIIKHNLKTLYLIDSAPCDTYLRQRLDAISPIELRHVFKTIFANLQRGRALEDFKYIDNHYLLSIDGTGYFSSKKIHRDQYCEKHHHDGTISYYHQLLGAV